MSELIDSFVKLKSQMETLKNQFRNEGKSLLEAAAKVFFDKFEHLKSFTVVGYTPYFNDGDVCNYGRHLQYVNGEYYDDQPKENKFWSKQAVKEIETFVTSLDKDLWKVFGDHRRFIFSRDGLIIEEFADHE